MVLYSKGYNTNIIDIIQRRVLYAKARVLYSKGYNTNMKKCIIQRSMVLYGEKILYKYEWYNITLVYSEYTTGIQRNGIQLKLLIIYYWYIANTILIYSYKWYNSNIKMGIQ